MKITSRFDSKKAREFLKEKMGDASTWAKTETLEYGKMFTKAAVAWTPPSGGGKNGRRITGTAAKKAQEERIWKDFMNPDRSPFIIVPKKFKGEIVDPRTHLRKFKMKRGKKSWYLDWRGPRVFATKQAITAEYNRRKSHIGRLASGWLEGARLSGLKGGIPAWVSRHGEGRGKARIANQGGKWTMIITNKIQESYDSQQMEHIVLYLLDDAVASKIKIRKENIKKWLIRGAKKAGRISLD